MNARELSEKYFEQSAKIAELEKDVSYLKDVIAKQQLKVKDLSLDLNMLENEMRRLKK